MKTVLKGNHSSIINIDIKSISLKNIKKIRFKFKFIFMIFYHL